MKQRKQQPMTSHTEPEAVRRKMAEDFRKLSTGKRFTPAERAEFARMADSWASTLPENKSVH